MCLQFLRPLESSSSLLAHALPTLGSAHSADSMNSRAIGVTNRISSTTVLKPLTVWITANWKILKDMGLSDHLTCLLRNLYAGQETVVRTGHRTMDWFKMRRGFHPGCILSPCLFNVLA